MSYQNTPRRNDRERRDDNSRPNVSEQQLQAIIGGDDETAVQTLVKTAHSVGKWLADMKFTTSQIRTIFGEVRRIEQQTASYDDQLLSMKDYRDLALLKPKLAYQHARAGGEGKADAKKAMEFLHDLLSASIDLVGRDRTRFTHFVEFFEAILAYHRSAGGKN
jgi:CRISPR-associated protein Csm2